MRFRSIAGGVFALSFLLVGCGRPVENRAERAIADLLPRYLGHADKYTVHVSGRPDAIFRGRLRSVHIEGTNVALMKDMLVQNLTIDVKDVSVDREKNTVKHIGETRFSACVSEQTINQYIHQRPRKLKDLSIALNSDGKATVVTRPEILGYPTLPVSLRGIVRVEGDGTHLDFYPDKASVDLTVGTIGTNLPDFVADFIAGQINPVADLQEVPFPIVAESVTLEQGMATITGHIPPGELQKAIARISEP